MSLKERILFGFCIIYWGILGIGLFTVSGLGSIPSFSGLIILISLALLFLVRKKSANIIGTRGLYLSSMLLFSWVSLALLFFFRSNEPVYYIIFLFLILNFVIAYYTSKISKVKNEM